MVNTIFHLKDVDTPSSPDNISHTLRELDPWDKETKKGSGPVEELESIKLDDQHLEHLIQIGLQLPRSLWGKLVDFLKDMFPWSYDDMLDIDPSVIVHRLNIDLNHKPVI